MPNNLKLLREKKNKSIRDLSTEIGINTTAIWKMETGIQQISESYAILLSNYFHVTIDYLFGRDVKPQDEKIVYKDKELNYSVVVSKLNDFTNRELLSVSGIIDYILEERSKTTPNQQLIKNKLESVVRKESNN